MNSAGLNRREVGLAWVQKLCLWGGIALWGVSMAAVSTEPSEPTMASPLHLGVASCASSLCHGAVTPHEQSSVLQNEYFVWSREDRHAQAYKSLLTDEAVQIGRRLGLVAHESARCLSCHADAVPQAQRGEQFQLSDGVSCEACHGGAQNWLPVHVQRGATHAKNRAAGLYPTEDPQYRAQLCLACHLGDAEHPIDHAIMGAGHPPLGFELDTFSAIQPSHYVVDEDYRQRKGNHAAVQVWATGQMVAAQKYLEELSGPRLAQGLFPELVLFDCYACHHSLSAERWSDAAAPGVGPGRVRLHSVNLSLVGMIVAVLEPAAALDYQNHLQALNQSAQVSTAALAQHATAMQPVLAGLIERHAHHKYSVLESWALMRLVSAYALITADFNLAEQTAMALEAIFLNLEQGENVQKSRAQALRKLLDQAYSLTNAVDDYKAAQYREILLAIRRQLPSVAVGRK